MRSVPLLIFLLCCLVPVTWGLEDYVSAKDVRARSGKAGPILRSRAAIVFDERDYGVLLARNAEEVVPVASLSKLMTAMVILNAGLDMDELITIVSEDKDRIRYSRSRLRTGMTFTRKDLLLIALAASENRAAAALARTYPGGRREFVQAMNNMVKELGLTKSRFVDASGLSKNNVSTARELIKIVQAASTYPVIASFSTQAQRSITDAKSGRTIEFNNTNRLVRRSDWPITLSKTGFTGDAGNCLVMKTVINERPVIIVLLNSWGKLSKYGDSNRIKAWLTKTERSIVKGLAQGSAPSMTTRSSY